MEPRFLLDAMLGSLARWLRIGGVDAEYRRDSGDLELVEEAARDGRILLTRDEELSRRAKKRGVEALYVPPGSDRDALREVASAFDLRLDPEKSRCPRCNGELRPATKDEVTGTAPEGTLKNFSEFWRCEKCGSVFWRGSHWRSIRATLDSATNRGS